jgi:hypothetical protein
LNNELAVIKNRLIAVETATEKASITRFITGASYLEFTINKAGDYVVIINLYGTNLNNIVFYLPPSQNAQIVFDNYYGTGSTMRTVILQMKDTGTPAVQQNWRANKTFELDFTGAGFSVNYANLTIGER